MPQSGQQAAFIIVGQFSVETFLAYINLCSGFNML